MWLLIQFACTMLHAHIEVHTWYRENSREPRPLSSSRTYIVNTHKTLTLNIDNKHECSYISWLDICAYSTRVCIAACCYTHTCTQTCTDVTRPGYTYPHALSPTLRAYYTHMHVNTKMHAHVVVESRAYEAVYMYACIDVRTCVCTYAFMRVGSRTHLCSATTDATLHFWRKRDTLTHRMTLMPTSCAKITQYSHRKTMKLVPFKRTPDDYELNNLFFLKCRGTRRYDLNL
jgi:hypothetical protein